MLNKPYFITILLPILACLTACQSLAPSQPESSYVPDIPPNLDIQITTPTPIPIPPIADSDADGVADDKDACPQTPKDQVVDHQGCPIAVELIGRLSMEVRAFFNDRSLTLQSTDSIYNELNKVAIQMNKSPKSTAAVFGHISAREAQEDPQNHLSQDRAQLVKEMLVAQGIASERIITFDCNDNRQIAPNDSEEMTALNRLVYVRMFHNDEDDYLSLEDSCGCQRF